MVKRERTIPGTWLAALLLLALVAGGCSVNPATGQRTG